MTRHVYGSKEWAINGININQIQDFKGNDKTNNDKMKSISILRVIVNNIHTCHPVRTVVPGDLLEASLHSFVLEQSDAPDQVSHQYEVSPGLHVEGDDVVEV